MCFSAAASFGVSAILFIGGVVANKNIKDFLLIPFASLPILFSIQQFVEGFIWLSLTDSYYSNMHSISTHVFLLFAQVIWPALVPISIWLLEKNENRKKILGALSIIGILVSSYLFYGILNFKVNSLISGSHILYQMNFRHAGTNFIGVLYFIPTVLPAFVSSVRRMPYFALTILMSFLVTKLYFEDYLISVWCYFAATLSILIIWIINSMNAEAEKVNIKKSFIKNTNDLII
jgi:hypothetical protein